VNAVPKPSFFSEQIRTSILLLLSALGCHGLTVSIADRGAVGNGEVLNTAAIQKAVDDCAASGGGSVLVPAGVWVTGSIELKSKVALRLEAGAILRASSLISVISISMRGSVDNFSKASIAPVAVVTSHPRSSSIDAQLRARVSRHRPKKHARHTNAPAIAPPQLGKRDKRDVTSLGIIEAMIFR